MATGTDVLLVGMTMHPACAPQNFLRCQNNKTNYNLVCETLQFLDIMCGSTTGGLGLLGLYINEDNVGLVIQTLETLTEYCQGPCHENQVSSLVVAVVLVKEPRGCGWRCRATPTAGLACISHCLLSDLHRDS